MCSETIVVKNPPIVLGQDLIRTLNSTQNSKLLVVPTNIEFGKILLQIANRPVIVDGNQKKLIEQGSSQGSPKNKIHPTTCTTPPG